MKPPVLYAKVSPAPKVVSGQVTLYKHTWEDHIEPFHPDVEFHCVKNAMDDPCYICTSATTPGSLLLINENDKNEFGDVLRVPIKPDGGHNIVTSAYYSDANYHGTVIWKRGDDQGE